LKQCNHFSSQLAALLRYVNRSKWTWLKHEHAQSLNLNKINVYKENRIPCLCALFPLIWIEWEWKKLESFFLWLVLFHGSYNTKLLHAIRSSAYHHHNHMSPYFSFWSFAACNATCNRIKKPTRHNKTLRRNNKFFVFFFLLLSQLDVFF